MKRKAHGRNDRQNSCQDREGLRR